MLRITKETDYGILLMAYIAERPVGEIHTAREVADRSGLPFPTVSKILRSLAGRNILASHRGASGGYSLKKAAKDMSIAEVIRALQGPISMVQCGAEPGQCEQEGSCPTRANWTRVSKEVERALDSVPITDMVAECRPQT
jgi:FeS assembly SUF system regulator